MHNYELYIQVFNYVCTMYIVKILRVFVNNNHIRKFVGLCVDVYM